MNQTLTGKQKLAVHLERLRSQTFHFCSKFLWSRFALLHRSVLTIVQYKACITTINVMIFIPHCIALTSQTLPLTVWAKRTLFVPSIYQKRTHSEVDCALKTLTMSYTTRTRTKPANWKEKRNNGREHEVMWKNKSFSEWREWLKIWSVLSRSIGNQEAACLSVQLATTRKEHFPSRTCDP